MTGEPQALKNGRERAQRQRRREAIKRVRAWERWVHGGSDFRTIPTVPTDNDFKLARQHGTAGPARRMNGSKW